MGGRTRHVSVSHRWDFLQTTEYSPAFPLLHTSKSGRFNFLSHSHSRSLSLSLPSLTPSFHYILTYAHTHARTVSHTHLLYHTVVGLSGLTKSWVLFPVTYCQLYGRNRKWYNSNSITIIGCCLFKKQSKQYASVRDLNKVISTNCNTKCIWLWSKNSFKAEETGKPDRQMQILTKHLASLHLLHS